MPKIELGKSKFGILGLIVKKKISKTSTCTYKLNAFKVYVKVNVRL